MEIFCFRSQVMILGWCCSSCVFIYYLFINHKSRKDLRKLTVKDSNTATWLEQNGLRGAAPTEIKPRADRRSSQAAPFPLRALRASPGLGAGGAVAVHPGRLVPCEAGPLRGGQCFLGLGSGGDSGCLEGGVQPACSPWPACLGCPSRFCASVSFLPNGDNHTPLQELPWGSVRCYTRDPALG